jgi:class 3 adenylate cyclase
MAYISGKDRFSPGLFDLPQDITGGLPLQVIGQWVDSEQDQTTAQLLLEPHKVTGYSVSSDTAGLTRLTGEMGLLEILAIINQPKEIIYKMGMAIGGRALGVWAADNTQMFYPRSVSAATILSSLLTAQDVINRDCHVKIGLGAHFGEFYSLSGGLYGAEADAIEELTENETEGGEIVITEKLRAQLPDDHEFTLVQRDDASPSLGAVFRVLDGPRAAWGAEALAAEGRYPIPYSDSFYDALVAYQRRLNDASYGRRLAEEHLQNKVVTLIERESLAAESNEVALCYNLSLSALLKDTGMRLLAETPGVEVKVTGPLGIYIFDDAGAALAFAQAFRRALSQEGLACRIGIDAGPVLVFDLATGGSDIAGMAVNMASKMAQDKGQMGKLYLSVAVKERIEEGSFTELRYTVSGVEVVAYEG